MHIFMVVATYRIRARFRLRVYVVNIGNRAIVMLVWHGGIVVRTSDLQPKGRRFKFRPFCFM